MRGFARALGSCWPQTPAFVGLVPPTTTDIRYSYCTDLSPGCCVSASHVSYNYLLPYIDRQTRRSLYFQDHAADYEHYIIR
jgi:hypothetical protein